VHRGSCTDLKTSWSYKLFDTFTQSSKCKGCWKCRSM